MSQKDKIYLIKHNLKWPIAIFIIIFLFFLVIKHQDLKKSVMNHSDIFIKKIKIASSNIPACSVQKVFSLPDDSTLIIGHGYGSPKSKNEKLDAGLSKFLKKNKGKFSRIIFTGDIFKNPSLQKWDYLKKFSEELNFDYYIAPGNHDVGYGKSRERSIFDKFFLSSLTYPQILKGKNSLIVIDDSTINPWRFQPKTFEIIKNNANTDTTLFLISHHISSDELSIFANSQDFKPTNLLSLNELNMRFKGLYKKIYIVNGDTGAHNFLPSTSCIEDEDILNIVNGIGGKNTDEILILENENIVRISIN